MGGFLTEISLIVYALMGLYLLYVVILVILFIDIFCFYFELKSFPASIHVMDNRHVLAI